MEILIPQFMVQGCAKIIEQKRKIPKTATIKSIQIYTY